MNRGSRKPVKSSRQLFNHFNSRFMKKISFFLLAALLVGVASAFTTVKPITTQTAYGFDGVQWHEIRVEDIGETYLCNTGTEFCLYNQPNGTPLAGETEDFEFVKLP